MQVMCCLFRSGHGRVNEMGLLWFFFKMYLRVSVPELHEAYKGDQLNMRHGNVVKQCNVMSA